MLLLFTEKYGKISTGTNLNEKSKNRSSLAIRPFTFGNYQIYEGKNYYNLDGAETIRSYYSIGEDLDRYMVSSYILELTEKIIPLEVPQPGIFRLLIDFMDEVSVRRGQYGTLVLAYEIRALRMLGVFPQTGECSRCGRSDGLAYFSIPDGGMLCSSCFQKIRDAAEHPLIYHTKFDIVSVLNYLGSGSFSAFRDIALEQDTARRLQRIIREYISYYLDVGHLKSESLLDAQIRKGKGGNGRPGNQGG